MIKHGKDKSDHVILDKNLHSADSPGHFTSSLDTGDYVIWSIPKMPASFQSAHSILDHEISMIHPLGLESRRNLSLRLCVFDKNRNALFVYSLLNLEL